MLGRPKTEETLECEKIEKLCVICNKKLILKTYDDVLKKKCCSIQCRSIFLSKRKIDRGQCLLCNAELKRKNVTGYCKKCFGKTTAKYDEYEYKQQNGTIISIRTDIFCSKCNRPLLKHSKEENKTHICIDCFERPLNSRLMLICPQCGEDFERLESSINGKLTFCSISCSAKYNSRRNGSGKSPLKNSIRASNKHKKMIFSCLERDNFKCVKCGESKELNAHHIKHFGVILSEFLSIHQNLSPKILEDRIKLLELSEEYEPFWDLLNLITLCLDCHQLEHPNIGLNSRKDRAARKKKESGG